ncbi:hypothetical protein [Mesorhizobium amorphae]|uniref:hypothetical protein n=1 Tax=Mesorhizobium amorphae TaxID=71433 RepID=UPI00178259E0|nr:hypothetical protein [Mesorhizobium amorphae]
MVLELQIRQLAAAPHAAPVGGVVEIRPFAGGEIITVGRFSLLPAFGDTQDEVQTIRLDLSNWQTDGAVLDSGFEVTVRPINTLTGVAVAWPVYEIVGASFGPAGQ